MPRNGSGVYSLPAGNPVVGGTLIEATWANPTMSDIAVQLNGVITRDGILGPTHPIKFQPGTVGAPGISFQSAPTTGLFHIGGAYLGFSYNGVLRMNVNGTGVQVEGAFSASGPVSFPSSVTFGGSLAFAAPLTIPNGGTGAVSASGARLNLGLVIGDDIPAPTGTGASGTWGIDISGSAAYATLAGTVSNMPAVLQGKLSKSGSNLKLSPFSGNSITIDGVVHTIPSGGVSLAPPATSEVTYMIYAYMVGSVMTLEASTTAHATDAITGVEIKSGDPTRTLVGMARTVSSAWVDTLQQRFVISWQNRSLRSVNNTLKANRSTASTSAVELSIAGDRAEFLCWAGDVDISHQASAQFTGAGNTMIGWTVLDGSFLTGGSTQSFGAGSGEAFYLGGRVGATVAEGYHYVGIGGQVGTGTVLWVSGQCAASASFMG